MDEMERTEQTGPTPISRRKLLKIGASALAASLLAACGRPKEESPSSESSSVKVKGPELDVAPTQRINETKNLQEIQIAQWINLGEWNAKVLHPTETDSGEKGMKNLSVEIQFQNLTDKTAVARGIKQNYLFKVMAAAGIAYENHKTLFYEQGKDSLANEKNEVLPIKPNQSIFVDLYFLIPMDFKKYSLEIASRENGETLGKIRLFKP